MIHGNIAGDSPSGLAAPPKFRVLAIDDERDILELVKFSLEPRHEVIAVVDSMEAADIIEVVEPDLLILDVMMPKVTGYQILESVRQSPKHQNMQALFLSAKDTPRDVKYGYKLGANFYLTKPFQPERLAKTVDMMLEPLKPPRRKILSMRDIALRIQMRVAYGGSGAAGPAAAQLSAGGPASAGGGEVGGGGQRFKRPLAQSPADADKKKWFG